MKINCAACIFDMDELLLASVPQWRGAIEHLLSLISGQLTPELAAKYQGRNAPDVARVLWHEFKPDATEEECIDILRAELLRRFARELLVPMPGAVECVRRLSDHFPLAVASGSPLEAIESAMNALEIAPCFRVLLSSESVARGKPHPDVFLAAAQALSVPAARCLVFEDSLAGVQAARAANMKVFAVPSGPHREEIVMLADRVFESLGDVRVEDVAFVVGK